MGVGRGRGSSRTLRNSSCAKPWRVAVVGARMTGLGAAQRMTGVRTGVGVRILVRAGAGVAAVASGVARASEAAECVASEAARRQASEDVASVVASVRQVSQLILQRSYVSLLVCIFDSMAKILVRSVSAWSWIWPEGTAPVWWAGRTSALGDATLDGAGRAGTGRPDGSGGAGRAGRAG